MTDHLEAAAVKAVELARELSTPLADPEDDNDVIRRRIRVAQHLTYLAGLVRGGAARPSPAQTWEQMKDRARLSPVTVHHNEMGGDTWVTTQGMIASERAARLQVEQKLDEVRWYRDRYLRQRNVLMDAVRKAVPVAGRADPALNELHDLAARIERQDETSTEGKG